MDNFRDLMKQNAELKKQIDTLNRERMFLNYSENARSQDILRIEEHKERYLMNIVRNETKDLQQQLDIAVGALEYVSKLHENIDETGTWGKHIEATLKQALKQIK